MSDLHAQLRSFFQQQGIQLNLVASSPRQAGTMLLIALARADRALGHDAIGWLNEPGNLGVLPGCRFNDPANPRSEVAMDRLLLIAAQLALIQWRLQALPRSGAPAASDDPASLLAAFDHWATAGFSSGDRIDRRRLLTFLGEAVDHSKRGRSRIPGRPPCLDPALPHRELGSGAAHDVRERCRGLCAGS